MVTHLDLPSIAYRARMPPPASSRAPTWDPSPEDMDPGSSPAIEHALKHPVWITLAARRSQSVFIIDPRKDDDPGLRVEPENNLNRRPILARRQCLNAAPIELPCRYSSRFGSLGTTSKISFDKPAKSRTLALDSKPCGSCCRARSAADCSFCNCSNKHS